MDEQAEPARIAQDDTMARVLGANFSRLSAVELGAKHGLGPLGPQGRTVWHGEARPCVSCGLLIKRTASRCDHCGQLLTGDMIQKMRRHSGPWYVLEHVRPFPGVSRERLILQIRRGMLTQTTIIRGPETHHQWRFAGETPGISKYLGVCWACQATVHEDDTTCAVCRKKLDSDGEEVLIEGDETLNVPKPELDKLKDVVRSAAPRRRAPDEPARIGTIPAWWFVAALIVVLMAVVYFVAQTRQHTPVNGMRDASDAVPLVLPDSPETDPTAAVDGGG